MQIYTSHNRKQQRKSPGACAMFIESNNAEKVGEIITFYCTLQPVRVIITPGHRPPCNSIGRVEILFIRVSVNCCASFLNAATLWSQSSYRGARLFHSMLGWVASAFIQFVSELQTLCFAHPNQPSPLKVLEGFKVGTLTFYLDCVGGTLYLFNSSRPPWLSPLPLENFHTPSPASIMTSQREPWWLLRASVLHTKLVCTKPR